MLDTGDIAVALAGITNREKTVISCCRKPLSKVEETLWLWPLCLSQVKTEQTKNQLAESERQRRTTNENESKSQLSKESFLNWKCVIHLLDFGHVFFFVCFFSAG